MGLVQRQSLKFTIITYAGLALGALNVLYLMPAILSQEQMGVVQYVIRIGQMLYPFAMLGAGALVIRYFPSFRDDSRGHRGLLLLVLGLALAGLGLFSVLGLGLQDWIRGLYSEKSPLLRQYLLYILPMMAFIGLANLLTAYTANFHRIAVPALFNNLYIKVMQAGLLLLFTGGLLSFFSLMNTLLLAYASVLLFLLLYLRRLGQLQFRRPDRRLLREHGRAMGAYAGFGILGSIGTVMASQIDIFMVGLLSGAAPVAVYSIGFFIADVIDVPRRSIESISAPLVAEAWQRDDRAQIDDLYRKSAINQLLLGLGLLLCIWTGLDSLFALIPNGERFEAGKTVVLLLGVGKLFDLMSGINRLVLVYSPRFRLEFYATLFMAVVNVIANLIFIPRYQIAGAALATGFSVLLFNLIKLGIVWHYFRLQPFTVQTLRLLGLSALLFALGWVIPELPNPLLDLPLRVALVGGLYLLAVRILRISPEFNAMMDRFFEIGNRK